MYANDKTQDPNYWNREIILKVRLNQAEFDALAKLAAAQGIARPALMRKFLHQATSK
jgi:predicted DNA binding CopG/RHH family protein